MSTRFGYRALRWAAVAALLALLLMVWGVIDPQPIALVLAMTVGQALGTLSFVVYGLVVLHDLRRARVLGSLVTRLSGPSSPPDEPPQAE